VPSRRMLSRLGLGFTTDAVNRLIKPLSFRLVRR
jgi:hypothetical protein